MLWHIFHLWHLSYICQISKADKYIQWIYWIWNTINLLNMMNFGMLSRWRIVMLHGQAVYCKSKWVTSFWLSCQRPLDTHIRQSTRYLLTYPESQLRMRCTNVRRGDTWMQHLKNFNSGYSVDIPQTTQQHPINLKRTWFCSLGWITGYVCKYP